MTFDVIIVGAGISGCATYLYLKKLVDQKSLPKHDLRVQLLEKRDATQGETVQGCKDQPVASAGIGGALGISPNGMHVLQDLDENLFQEVCNDGNKIRSFDMRSASGFRLAKFPAEDQCNPPLPTILIGRYELWKILRNRVLDRDVIKADVSHIISKPGHKPLVTLTDDSTVMQADLVLGADGVKSSVRKAVTDDARGGKYAATYEGLTSVFGWIAASDLGESHRKDEMVMTLGSDSFFGYGICSSAKDDDTSADRAVWWSTYPLDEEPLASPRLDPHSLVRNLQSRHLGWHDPAIRHISASAHVDHVYPTWTVPELPTWTLNGNVALVGDAAHALQSSSGQGVSQALEDAQVLSTLLATFIDDGDDGVAVALKKYVDIRKPRIDRIVARSKQMGNTKRRKNLLEEWVTFFFVWLAGKWPWDSYNEWLFGELPADELKKLVR